ncbi:MAG: hypothetical protein EA426_11160 [Spirochaetaceae bacterium]|nr:MAG: hypothetical protein EA426_11160 [Spirochaetaceae bacterium]
MDTSTRCLKRRLCEREVIFGTGLSLGSLRAAELVGRTRFDFVMVDTMHGHYDKVGATDSIRSLLRAGGPTPVARVSENSAGQINDMLDAGALGIVVPMIETRAEAEAAVQACFYPPVGRRSKGSVAPVMHGADYVARANSIISLIAMIETPDAAANADDILGVPGVTACLIGASDLEFVLGTGRDSSGFLGAVDRIVAAGLSHGVAVGISISSADETNRWIDRGLSFFLASHDLAILGSAIRRYDESFTVVRAGAGDGNGVRSRS